MNKDVIATKNRSNEINTAIFCTVVAVLMGVYLLIKGNALRGSDRLELTFFCLCFLLVAVICWLIIFDTAPIYKMSQDGIYLRRKFLSKKFNQFIKWNDVEYFFVEIIYRTREETLIIKTISGEKYIKLSLSSLDNQKESLLNFIRDKAGEYNFHDLLTEVNENSRY
jgi:hypothetical protein